MVCLVAALVGTLSVTAGAAQTLSQAAAPTPTTVSAGTPSVSDLTLAVLAALNAGDVDTALTYFSDNTTLTSAAFSQQYTTKDGVRTWAQGVVDGHGLLTVLTTNVQGNQGTWLLHVSLDSFRNMGIAPANVGLDVTADGGLITSWRASYPSDTQAALDAATQQTQLITQFLTALNAGDLDGSMGLVSDDVQITGAFGDKVVGKPQARSYYAGLIASHLALSPFGDMLVEGDRVTATYGLATDALQTGGVASAETIGQFYVQNGQIVGVTAAFTPNSAAAVRAAQGQ